MELQFPQYRRLRGTEALYAIEGPKHVTEWQPLGADKWMVHRHFASDYPRYQWVQELLNQVGKVDRLSEEEWLAAVAQREGSAAIDGTGREVKLSAKPHVERALALGPLTTFGVAAKAAYAVEAHSDAAVRWVLGHVRSLEAPLLILGGGSNVLLHADWPGWVMRMSIKGMQCLSDDGDTIEAVVGAGESWHDWVLYSLEQGWHGLENLALIPGSVGASPMQNIGAYGAEVKDRFLWLEAIHRETGALERFDAQRCDFGYRESTFKQSERDRWVIVRVAFRLHRTAPILTDYGAIQSELEQAGILESPSHREVAEAVMRIRRSKLPNPAEIGNAGSFFKNPTLTAAEFAPLLAQHPTIAHYPLEDGSVKIAAGWLIDQAGWKGHRRDRCGVHDRQALVLVNFGGATGAEIWALAQDVMSDVRSKFGVDLEPEVNQVRPNELARSSSE